MIWEKAQRNFYEFPEEPPAPVGYIIGPKLLNDVLGVWWGERAYLNSATVFGHEVGLGTNLGTLEQEGQILVAIDKIIAADQSKDIKFIVAKKNSDRPEPVDCLLLDNGLRTGWVRTGKDGAAALIKGAALILGEQEAKAWLGQLRSPHVLPNDPLTYHLTDHLTRDSLELPKKDKVSLCDLVMWLADGKALQGEDDAARLKDRQAFLTKFLDRSSAAESSDRWRLDPIWKDCDRPSLARLVAEEIAREVRVGSVKAEIIGAMQRGKLKGYAGAAPGSGQREAIPSQELPELLPPNFVFERDDLIRLWGDVTDGNSSGPARGMDADPTILPRFFRPKAEVAYQQRVEKWSPDADPPSGKDDEDWFKSEFGAPRQFAREMRKKHAPEAWRARGRRKTRRN